MQGGCIADIGSCGTGFDSASGSVRTKKFRTKGSELADRKGEKNKAMPRAPSICCSSIDEALSFSSRARCNKRLVLFPSHEPRERPAPRRAKLIFKTGLWGNQNSPLNPVDQLPYIIIFHCISYEGKI
ncbi:hypothetical protein ACQJBY_022703 [Aegilops geniculata]